MLEFKWRWKSQTCFVLNSPDIADAARCPTKDPPPCGLINPKAQKHETCANPMWHSLVCGQKCNFKWSCKKNKEVSLMCRWAENKGTLTPEIMVINYDPDRDGV